MLEGDCMETSGVIGQIILKRIVKLDVREWTGFMWLEIVCNRLWIALRLTHMLFRVAEDSDCVFPIWITQRDRFGFKHTMPYSDHAALQATSHCHGTARHNMCDLPRFGLFRRPRGVSRLVVRIFPATSGILRRTRHCPRTAGAQHGMCELARHGTVCVHELLNRRAVSVVSTDSTEWGSYKNRLLKKPVFRFQYFQKTG